MERERGHDVAAALLAEEVDPVEGEDGGATKRREGGHQLAQRDGPGSGAPGSMRARVASSDPDRPSADAIRRHSR